MADGGWLIVARIADGKVLVQEAGLPAPAVLPLDLFLEQWAGAEGAKGLRQWIRDQIAANRPYDQFAHDVLTATGSNREHPAAAYFKTLRDPAATMENTTHLFLGVRFNCNKCHDHPFEKWTMDQYYETASYFAQIDLKGDPQAKGATIGGSAVEGAVRRRSDPAAVVEIFPEQRSHQPKG
jgi:hypothetical protein